MNEFDVLENFCYIFLGMILYERNRYANMKTRQHKKNAGLIEYTDPSVFVKVLNHFNINDYRMIKDGIYEVLFQKIAQISHTDLMETDMEEIDI